MFLQNQSDLGLCCLSSANNSCKQLGPIQAQQNFRPYLDPNWLTLWWFAWKKLFLKLLILNNMVLNLQMQYIIQIALFAE